MEISFTNLANERSENSRVHADKMPNCTITIKDEMVLRATWII